MDWTSFRAPRWVGLALTLAMPLNRKLKGIGFFRVAIFFPYITSLVAVAAYGLQFQGVRPSDSFHVSCQSKVSPPLASMTQGCQGSLESRSKHHRSSKGEVKLGLIPLASLAAEPGWNPNYSPTFSFSIALIKWIEIRQGELPGTVEARGLLGPASPRRRDPSLEKALP
jgi:hypothetical protein